MSPLTYVAHTEWSRSCFDKATTGGASRQLLTRPGSPAGAGSTALPVALAQAAAPASLLGDLSSFNAIAKDTLTLVEEGNLAAAEKRITDFETAWDKAEHELYHMDKAAWGIVDDAADKAISSLRAKKPVQAKAQTAVAGLIAAVENPSVP